MKFSPLLCKKTVKVTWPHQKAPYRKHHWTSNSNSVIWLVNNELKIYSQAQVKTPCYVDLSFRDFLIEVSLSRVQKVLKLLFIPGCSSFLKFRTTVVVFSWTSNHSKKKWHLALRTHNISYKFEFGIRCWEYRVLHKDVKKNHRHPLSHWQTWSHNVVSNSNTSCHVWKSKTQLIVFLMKTQQPYDHSHDEPRLVC
jgi:hypothetical protein